MPWLRIDDQFPDHPKIVKAGVEAAWLYVCGLAYCSRYLTDGNIPSEVATSLVRGKSHTSTLKLASKLVAVGLWMKAPDGSFDVKDYLEYNPSRYEIEQKRSEARERMSRARFARSSPDVRANKSRSSPNPHPQTHTPDLDLGCELTDVESVSNAAGNGVHEQPSTTSLQDKIAKLAAKKAMPS